MVDGWPCQRHRLAEPTCTRRSFDNSAAQGVRGLDAEFVAEEVTAQLILPVASPWFPSARWALIKDPMGTLAERLGSDGGQAGVDGFAVAPSGDEPVAKRLQRVQAELMKPLTFHQHPVIVIPGRE